MKIRYPELYDCPLPSECNAVFSLQGQTVLHERDQLGRRVFIIKIGKFGAAS